MRSGVRKERSRRVGRNRIEGGQGYIEEEEDIEMTESGEREKEEERE